MSNINNEKVSNSMIIISIVIIILIMTGIVLAFFIKDKILNRNTDDHPGYKVIYYENFGSSPSASADPEIPVWRGWGSWSIKNAPGDNSSRHGNAGSMSGSLVSMGSAAIYKDMDAGLPLIIEFDCWNSDEAFSPNAHAPRGMVYIFSGHQDNGYWLFIFNKDGSLHLGYEKINGFKWQPKRWYHVRIRLSRTNEGISARLYIDGAEVSNHVLSDRNLKWLKDWEKVRISFCSGSGTAYFDNIRLLGRKD